MHVSNFKDLYISVFRKVYFYFLVQFIFCSMGIDIRYRPHFESRRLSLGWRLWIGFKLRISIMLLFKWTQFIIEEDLELERSRGKHNLLLQKFSWNCLPPPCRSTICQGDKYNDCRLEKLRYCFRKFSLFPSALI